MTDERGHRLGLGPLTARRVITDALGMLRQSFARIAGVALVFFALPALIAVAAERAIASLPTEPGVMTTIVALSAVAAAVSLRVLGPVAFAGFLDEAVAKEYLHGHRHSLGNVLRSLPWRRLVAADLIVVLVVGIGLELLVLPGLVAFGGLGLVGVVIVQERDNVANSFRRTLQLALSAPGMVALLVVTPFAFEQVVHEVVLHTLETTTGIGVQLVAEWFLAVILGGTLGLLEVALATELIARNPRASSAALLDDGQAPAV